MTPDDNHADTKTAGRPSPGLLLFLAGLLSLAMAVGGYLVGRSSAAPGVVEVVAQPLTPTNLPPTAAPPTALPTQTPPPSPTATPEPTAVPVPATLAPTATIPPVIGGPSPLDGADLSTFYEVWGLIADEYDGAMPPQDELMQSAIAGSLETLDDDYTRYVPPDIAARMRQDMAGSVEGIGAYVRENEDGLFEIVRPIDGQPADLAGLQPGDIITAVDGQSVLDISFDEVILMVRGPEGTSVTLTVARQDEPEPLEFTIVRARYEVPVVEFEMLPAEITGGAAVGYIRLAEFNANAEERLLAALGEIMAQQPVGLVFDLRDNPGGFLDQSVAVADAFLPSGVALFERNIRGLDETFTTDDGDIAESIPLVVLVNAGSASASEIVAGAIQDRGRGVLVGETTFGKGSVQQIHPLADGSELRITIARWYTPDNHTIDGEGIVPDFEVESPEDLGGVEDGQLRRAVEYILTGQ